jgi:hypothetical protein
MSPIQMMHSPVQQNCGYQQSVLTILLTMALNILFTGCTAGPPASANVREAKQITLYEGLPHPFDEPRSLQAEKDAKPTVELRGYLFYRETLTWKPGDEATLRDLLVNPRSFQSYSGEKKCGGFHPDYAAEWTLDGQVYQWFICFHCRESRTYGPNGKIEYDIAPEAYNALKNLLMPYRKSRPPQSFQM